jgi:hypothetical protein
MGNGSMTVELGMVTTAMNFNSTTITPEGSTLIIQGRITNTVAFSNLARTWNRVKFGFTTSSAGSFTFGALSNTFAELEIMPQCRVGFNGSTTQTATIFKGMKGIRLFRASGTTPFVLAKAGGGTVDMSYANISNMTGSPINTFNAVNSVNAGGNTNISFIKDDRDYNRFLS